MLLGRTADFSVSVDSWLLIGISMYLYIVNLGNARRLMSYNVPRTHRTSTLKCFHGCITSLELLAAKYFSPLVKLGGSHKGDIAKKHLASFGRKFLTPSRNSLHLDLVLRIRKSEIYPSDKAGRI